jgi:ribose 5-phosphate isomerase B
LKLRVVVGADDESAALDAAIQAFRADGADIEVLPRADWPDVARSVAERVAGGMADVGLLMCWTGTGTSIMANKVRGVRAALCWEPWIADGARRWNDANVLVMSLKRTTADVAREIVQAWLAVEAPDPDEAGNIDKVSEYEDEK